MLIEDYRTVDLDAISKMQYNLAPQWGKMTLQHMIEHLSLLFKIANGSNPVEITVPLDKVEKIKRIALFSDREFQQNFKAPILPDEPLPYKYNGMTEAIDHLKTEIEKYHLHYKNKPSQTENHPLFGALDYEGWECYHNKHFTHHLKQFALV